MISAYLEPNVKSVLRATRKNAPTEEGQGAKSDRASHHALQDSCLRSAPNWRSECVRAGASQRLLMANGF
jgi:hypothetical protein